MKKILIICISAVLALSSCVNEDEQLGLNLVGDNGAIDVLRAYGTGVTTKATMYNTDTLVTANLRYNILGTYKDDNFGKLSSSIYTQVNLSSAGQNFALLGTPDSVVLSLLYAEKGAMVSRKDIHKMRMHFKVEELAEELVKEKQYAKDEVAVKPEALFDDEVMVDMDSANIHLGADTMTYPVHLRLRLKDEFLHRLANSSFDDNNAFMSEFKGIKISATNNDVNGMMMYIDMASVYSCITYYYSTPDGRHYNYKMPFPTTGQRFMHIDFDYCPSLRSVMDTTTETDQTYMYLCGLGMSEIKLDILGLDTWYNRDTIKDKIINKVELILPVADLSGDKFTYPSSLQCLRKEGEKFYFIRDEYIATTVNAVPYYDTTINAYRVQLTSFIHNYLQGKYEDATVYIVPANRDRQNADGGYSRRNTASRVVLNGPAFSDENRRPKLNITYSNLNSK